MFVEDLEEAGVDASPMVVGFDGSAGARLALRWALAEAVRRSVPVRLVYAVDPAGGATARAARGLPSRAPANDDSIRSHAQAVLADAIAEAREVCPTVGVSPVIRDCPAVPALCESSRTAALLVLGGGRSAGLTGRFLGSIAGTVAGRAACPVVVVRGDETGGPVVVGVDEGPDGDRVVEFALAEAALRGAGVLAVRAWSGRDSQEAHRRRLSEVVDRWSGTFPEVPVTTRLVHADPRRALDTASRPAQLVVVGGRGRGGIAELLLGSVSRYLVQQAGCPVAVVRP